MKECFLDSSSFALRRNSSEWQKKVRSSWYVKCRKVSHKKILLNCFSNFYNL